MRIVKDLGLDGFVECVVLFEESFPRPGRAIVVHVSQPDPVIDEEAEDIRRQVDREDDEVTPIVVVEQVDTDSWVVYRLALHPQQAWNADLRWLHWMSVNIDDEKYHEKIVIEMSTVPSTQNMSPIWTLVMRMLEGRKVAFTKFSTFSR